jgi:hypothetical protein
MGADGPTQITVYLAYWAPGEATPSQVAIHTPDGCWPGAGWIRIPQPISRLCLKTSSQSLPESEYRQFKDPSGLVQEVWYWHLYDKKPIEQLNPYAINELLKMSMRFGFHRTGEQLFVRFSSNRSWEMIRTDPLVSQIVNNLAPFGLIEAQKKPEKN